MNPRKVIRHGLTALPGRARLPQHERKCQASSEAAVSSIKRDRTGYTANDKPVRVMISIIPGVTLILQYTITT